MSYQSRYLYLGSKSSSRRLLLEQMGIRFELLQQDADESQSDWGLDFPLLLASIAVHKMEQVIMPLGQEGDCAFVLTADTMSRDIDGTVHGKPSDWADAIAKIKLLSRGGYIGTAFCLDKKVYRNGQWLVDTRIQEFVDARYRFEVPDYMLEPYLKTIEYLNVSGALCIEGFGQQFLKEVDGSYSTILGLPVFQVRVALESIGFFNF